MNEGAVTKKICGKKFLHDLEGPAPFCMSNENVKNTHCGFTYGQFITFSLISSNFSFHNIVLVDFIV